MTIVELLKTEQARVKIGSRWLVWDDWAGDGEWVVFERRPYSKKSIVLIRTPNEHKAVEILLKTI